MAWFAAAAPFIQGAATAASVAATVAQAQGQRKIGEYNARQAEASAKVEQDQATREEEALRRGQNQFFGRQRAAMSEAGLGPGGSTGMLANQDAALAELDALNVRYGGTLSGKGLLSEAASRRAGKPSNGGIAMLAGAQLLAGASDTYKAYKIGKS